MFWTISIQQRNNTKQARLFELAFAVYGAAFPISARKTSIVSESHAEVNSSNFSGLEHSLCLSTRGHNRGGEVRFLREERRAPLPLLSGADEGLPSLHGEMCATARTHLLQSSGMCEGAAYGKAVPSRLSYLRSVSWQQSLYCFANFEKTKFNRLLPGQQSLHVFLTYVR